MAGVCPAQWKTLGSHSECSVAEERAEIRGGGAHQTAEDFDALVRTFGFPVIMWGNSQKAVV